MPSVVAASRSPRSSARNNRTAARHRPRSRSACTAPGLDLLGQRANPGRSREGRRATRRSASSARSRSSTDADRTASTRARGRTPSHASAKARIPMASASSAHTDSGSSPRNKRGGRRQRQLRRRRLHHRIGDVARTHLGQARLAAAQWPEEHTVGHHRVVHRIVVPDQRRPPTERGGPCLGLLDGDGVAHDGVAGPRDRHVGRNTPVQRIEVGRSNGAGVFGRHQHQVGAPASCSCSHAVSAAWRSPRPTAGGMSSRARATKRTPTSSSCSILVCRAVRSSVDS